MKMKRDAVSVMLCLCFLLGCPVRMFAEKYDDLWKQVKKYEAKDLPKSAYQTVLKIGEMAEKEKKQGQRMAALLYGCVLRQQVVPDSFYTDMLMLERKKRETRNEVERAVLASVLGELYKDNSIRGRSRGLTTAHPDSIREWSAEQYTAASAENYALSMAHPEILAEARAADFVPFVVKGRDAAYFQGDLLNVIGRRAVEGMRFTAEQRARWHGEMLKVYRKKGNRQAELLLMLDSVTKFQVVDVIPLSRKVVANETGTDDEQVLASDKCRAMLGMLERFSDLPLAAEIYIRLMYLPVSAERKVKWAEEGVKKYPSYPRIAVLKNRIRELQAPQIQLSLFHGGYPGTTQKCTVERRNLCGAELRWYRMPEGTTVKDVEKMKNEGTLKAAALRTGKPVKTQRLSWAKAEPWAWVTDSFTVEVPEVGLYVVVMHPDGVTSTKEEAVDFMASGRLSLFTQALPDSSVQVRVVDAMTGTPVPEATVTMLYNEKVYATAKTDSRGGAVITKVPDNDWYGGLRCFATKGKDKYMLPCHLYGNYSYSERAQHGMETHLYTDRGIYRPGQTVYVAGLYFIREGKNKRVAVNRPVKLVLYDANGKNIAERALKTDEMGKVSTDFVLPVTGLSGHYSVRGEKSRVNFKVEEYKRPTFEVTLKRVEEQYHPGETVTLRGEVMNFTGVPVRGACVTGVISLSRGYRLQDDTVGDLKLDTVYTDETGGFALRVPIRKYDDSRFFYGVYQTVKVSATGGAGETHEASTSLLLSRKGLQIDFGAPEMWDKAKWPRMDLRLRTMNGDVVKDSVTVYYDLLGMKQTASADTIWKDRVWTMRGEGCPEELKTLPKGDYELRFRAVAKGDTVALDHPFVLFDHNDTRPVEGHKDWFYVVRDSITPDAPAHVQVGSVLKDVTLFQTVFCKNKVLTDTLYTLTDSVLNFHVPYSEDMGDGVMVRFVFAKDGEWYTHDERLRVPQPDCTLRFNWTSFRDRLQPGSQETWKLRVTKPDGSPASAGLMATLYDASLDKLAWHYFEDVNDYFIGYFPYSSSSRSDIKGNLYRMYYSFRWNSLNYKNLLFDSFDRSMISGGYFASEEKYAMGASISGMNLAAAKARSTSQVASPTMDDQELAFGAPEAEMEDADETTAGDAGGDFSSVQLRKNLQETAFFYPQLTPDSTGEFTITFTLPESLTSWHFKAMAHTKDLMSGAFSDTIVAVKEVMARLDLPRFVRKGDRATLSTTLFNRTEAALKGRVTMEVFDPATGRSLWKDSRKLTLEAKSDSVVTFAYAPKADDGSLPACRVMFEADGHSDGEQRYLPVLEDSEWLTQTLPFVVDGKGVTEIKADELFQKNHPRATGRKLTVEYAAGPLWYAVQALPSVLEPDHRDALSLSASLYASLLSSRLAERYPELGATVEAWMHTSPEQLKSPLDEQDDLKGILLDETPWVADADAETRRMQSLTQLFDANRQADVQRRFSEALGRLQNEDGGMGWMDGMRSSEHVTLNVAQLLARAGLLQSGKMPAATGQHIDLRKMVDYLTGVLHRMVKDDKKYMSKNKMHLYSGGSWLPYLYLAGQVRGEWLGATVKADMNYAMDILVKDRHAFGMSDKAHAAVVLQRAGYKAYATELMQSIEEHLVKTSAGVHLEYPSKGYRSSQDKVAVQVAVMEAFATCRQDADSVMNGLGRWLLGQKRVQAWSTPVGSMNAVYALVDLRHDELKDRANDEVRLLSPSGKDLVKMRSSEGELAGLGYVTESIEGKDLKQGVGVIAVTKENDRPEAWGAVYAQFRLPLSDVESQAKGVSVRCEVSNERPKVGDRVVLRYVITADKDYEYVCLKAGRAACLEPVNALGGSAHYDGLGCYREVRDASTRYFFERLPKGTYVIEEECYVERAGEYSVGVARLSDVYAPEFCAYGNSPVLKVKP